MRRALIALTATATLALGACSGTNEAAPTKTVTTTPNASSSAAEPSAAGPSSAEPARGEPETTSESDDVLAPGDTHTYPDGLEITVGEISDYTPTPSAYVGNDTGTYVSFPVTIHNGTGRTGDPSMAMVSVTSGSSEAEEIFDDGTGAPLTTTLLDGRDITWTAAFAVKDAGDLVIEASPDWERPPSVFATSDQ